ncbi:MAG: hypothetical protein EOP34_11965, partial [Rickettsiales bacterium]
MMESIFVTSNNALANAVSGIRLAEQLLENSAKNIRHSRTENYARRDLQIKSVDNLGEGNGAVVTEVIRKIDQSMYNAIIEQISTFEYSKILDEYNQQIQLLFGSPGGNTTIDLALEDFFSSIKLLSENPEYNSLRFDTINKVKNLTDIISELAKNLQKLRYKADGDIKREFDHVNQQLQNLYSVNAALARIPGQDNAKADLVESRDNIVQDIAKRININTYYKSNDQVVINTSNGIPLISEHLYSINYEKITSFESLIGDNIIPETTILSKDGDGEIIDSHVLIPSGMGNNVDSTIKDGSILA